SDAGEASLQEAGARATALLGMELHAEDRAVLGDRRDALRRRRHGRRLGGVRVRIPVRVAAAVESRPADARHPALAQPNAASGHEPEPADAAVLLRLVERELQPEADAENRPAVCGA